MHQLEHNGGLRASFDGFLVEMTNKLIKHISHLIHTVSMEIIGESAQEWMLLHFIVLLS
jgi:hypothetical protein